MLGYGYVTPSVLRVNVGLFCVCYTAWCYMKPRGKATALFGYELWAYLVYITLPVLYIWIRCYVKIKVGAATI